MIYMVIDISCGRFPKGFDDMPPEIRMKYPVKVTQIGHTPMIIAGERILPWDQKNVDRIIVHDHKEINNEKWNEHSLLMFYEMLDGVDCLVSHNAETDIWLLNQVHCQVFGYNYSFPGRVYCTMKNGIKYGRTHAYIQGAKIKKYPHLQELCSVLFGGKFGKGDIREDIAQCYVCAAEMMEIEENKIEA